MHVVQMLRKPFVLARPIVFILWVGIAEVCRDSTLAPRRKVFPFQWITKLLLDRSLLAFQKP